jgi:hypothetical protein
MPSKPPVLKSLFDPVNLLIVVVAGLVTVLPTVGAVLLNRITEPRAPVAEAPAAPATPTVMISQR